MRVIWAGWLRSFIGRTKSALWFDVSLALLPNTKEVQKDTRVLGVDVLILITLYTSCSQIVKNRTSTHV